MNSASYPGDESPNGHTADGRPALVQRGRYSLMLLFRLAVADLWHERMLTACVVVALTAVIAPLLILLSLKYGLVETLRARLIDDPRNREVRPQTSNLFTDAQIDEMRQRPDVSFVIPLLSSFSTNVKVSLDGGSTGRAEADLVPTMEGDPLLEDNGTRVPALTQCALSQPLYHRLSANGDAIGSIHLHISRIVEGRFEEETVPLEVVGAVSERATSKETVFVQLQLLQEIEKYLQGMPVPRLGWKGEAQGIEPVVEQVVFALPRALEPLEQHQITATTAFSSLRDLPRTEFAQYVDVVPDAAQFFYLLSISSERKDRPAGAEDIQRLRSTLPTTAGDLYGLCQPLPELEVAYPDGKPVKTDVFQVQAEVVSAALKKAVPTSPSPPPARAPPAVTKKNEPAETKPSVKQPPTTSVGAGANGSKAGADAGKEKEEVVAPALPVQIMPDGTPKVVTKPVEVSKPTAGETEPVGPAPVPPPSGPRVMVPGPVGTTNPGSGGTPSFRLDGNVGPLTRPPPPPPPPRTSPSKGKDEKDDNKGSKGSKDEEPEKTKKSIFKRKTGAEGTWIRFSDEGARYVAAAAGSKAPANSDAAPVPKVEEQTPAVEYKPRTLLLPESWGVADGQMVVATMATPNGPVQFSAAVKTHAGTRPMIPQSLAGVLRATMDVPSKFDADLQAFVPTSSVWPSFRMVVRDIDSVQGVVDHFHDLGMNVITKAERIRDVKELDYYTGRVFWLIAAVGLSGAVGALLASLIAAVERKRRSLGVLRLLGMRRRSLLRLPFYQSTIVVSLSVGIAIAAWHWVSKAIATFTLRYLEAGETLQTLPPRYLLYMWAGAIGIAAVSSLLAGIRVMGVDPSEAIRDE